MLWKTTGVEPWISSKGIQIIEVCNPMQAKKVLEANMSLSTMLPCRISVYQEHGKTVIATLKPTALISGFKGIGLEEVALSVEKTIIKIMDEASL